MRRGGTLLRIRYATFRSLATPLRHSPYGKDACLQPEVSEVYLLATRGTARCLVCSPSAEALVDSLREGAFTLCPEHLLRAHVHGNDEDGIRSLHDMRPSGIAPARRPGTVVKT